MSKTLFWYIFSNLFRVFLMAVAGLTGIMCFAGTLKILTENGLDMTQVNRLLLYSIPAMSAYCLPVAALFAATTVYGRCSADNELVAMRSCGIGYISPRRFSIALPALVFGLIVAVASLLLLCFIVPIYSLKIRQVIFSNIGQVIAGQIEREHEITFRALGASNLVTVFAESAHVEPPRADQPRIQRVQLVGPAIMPFEFPDHTRPPVPVPREFWLARSAVLTISQNGFGKPGADTISFRVQLNDGIKIPREFSENVHVGVEGTTYGPIEIPSPVDENVKFLDVTRLTELAADASRSQRVQLVLHDLARREQERDYLQSIAAAISESGGGLFNFSTDPDNDDSFQISGKNVTASLNGEELVIQPKPGAAVEAGATTQGSIFRPIWMIQNHMSQPTLWANAREMHVRAKPDSLSHTFSVGIELFDVSIGVQDSTTDRVSFQRSFSSPMSDAMVEIENKTLADYQHDPQITSDDASSLLHEQLVVNNAVRTELHGRASFALSCLTQVMIGCAMGMIFRSGNFLNAFAVSFVPALLCTTLVFCGQTVSTHIPLYVPRNYHNPLPLALGFIWGGNLIVLAAGIYLTIKLQRR